MLFQLENPIGYPIPLIPNPYFDIKDEYKDITFSYSPFYSSVIGTTPCNKNDLCSLPRTYGLYGQIYTPLAEVVKYPDINSDPDLRNRVVNYFRDKVKKWLTNSYSNILNYYVIEKGDNVVLIKDLKNYVRENNDSDSVKDKKINHIKSTIVTKKFIAKLLERYSEKNNIKWWDLHDNSRFVKEYIHRKLEDAIKSAINEK